MVHTADTIRQAAQAVEYVKDIDDAIRHVARQTEVNAGHLGEVIRNSYGRNIVSMLLNEDLGRATGLAVIASLLERRHSTVMANQGVVEFPEPPSIAKPGEPKPEAPPPMARAMPEYTEGEDGEHAP